MKRTKNKILKEKSIKSNNENVKPEIKKCSVRWTTDTVNGGDGESRQCMSWWLEKETEFCGPWFHTTVVCKEVVSCVSTVLDYVVGSPDNLGPVNIL